MAHSSWALHLIIYSSNNVHWILTAVYNAQSYNLQQKLWKELTQIIRINQPWIILGDFNAITSPEEHQGSNYLYYARKAASFSNFIFGNSLIDANFSVAIFSWCNG